MRLVDLPVHPWDFKILEKLGDACEGISASTKLHGIWWISDGHESWFG